MRVPCLPKDAAPPWIGIIGRPRSLSKKLSLVDVLDLHFSQAEHHTFLHSLLVLLFFVEAYFFVQNRFPAPS